VLPLENRRGVICLIAARETVYHRCIARFTGSRISARTVTLRVAELVHATPSRHRVISGGDCRWRALYGGGGPLACRIGGASTRRLAHLIRHFSARGGRTRRKVDYEAGGRAMLTTSGFHGQHASAAR